MKLAGRPQSLGLAINLFQSVTTRKCTSEMLHYCATDCSYKKAKLSVPGLSRFGINKPATGVGITLPKRRKKKRKRKKERKGNINLLYGWKSK